MSPELFLFLVLIFIVATLYSSVGHGGASGYLALMSLFLVAPESMRSSALILNIFVSAIAWWQYSRSVKLNSKLFLWLIAGSIPAAFAGAMIEIDASVYKRILGILLILPAARLMGWIPARQQPGIQPVFLFAFAIGIGIGLISGIIGIGGGIILSPVLLLLGWTDIRQTALMSALFILLNSLSGMGGLISKGLNFEPILYLWITVAVMGGMLGSWAGSRKLTPENLKRILGVVLVIAGGKLIFF